MKALFGESKAGIQNLDGSQEPPVLYDESKAELKTSKMSTIPLTIQLYSEICSREKYGKGGWVK